MKLVVYVLYFVTCVIIPLTSSDDFNAEKDSNFNANELLQEEQREPQQQQSQHDDLLGSQLENIQQRNGRPAGCPADFVFLRSVHGCYKVVTDVLEWGLAGVRCRKLNSNAHLLIVNSASEQRAVVDELVNWYGGCPTGLWTAGQRLNPSTPDGFVWKIVNPIDYPSARIEEMTYTHWISGQPDFYKGVESCMSLWRDQQFAWNDAPCWARLCSVCEVDIQL